MIDTTVVISNYNYDQYVGSCIESCLVQKNTQIIVVDDASVDKSWEVICQYADKHPNVGAVRLKSNSNGNARGKNVGIGLSNTKYVICLDADDMLMPDSVECRLKIFEDNANTDFVHGWSIRFTGTESYHEIMNNKKMMNTPFKRNQKSQKLKKEKFSPRWSFAMEASTIVAKRRLYETLGLYDEKMGWSIDREMSWRWLDHAAKIGIADRYVSLYRHHDKQLTKDRKRKDPTKYSNLLLDRQIQRKVITSENTILLSEYNYEQYIKETRGA